MLHIARWKVILVALSLVFGVLFSLPNVVPAGALPKWMPQQRRLKQHKDMIGGIKRGDTVVLSSGIIGKVVRVEDAEVQVEIAPNTNARVVKSMVAEVRNRATPVAANDPKA